MSSIIAKFAASRRVLPGTLLALAACALPAASTSAGAQTAAAATPRCTVKHLEVWLGVGGGGAQAGGIDYPLEFTNVSRHACHLYGFPGVSAERAGRQLGSAAGRDRSAPKRTVRLRAGATAHTVLQITDVSAFPPSACRPARALALTVYPPGAVNAASIPFRFRACSAKGPVFLSVQPVRRRVGVPGHP